MARNMDFIIIPDNAAAAGMPNKRLLTTGDSTAVIRPTLMPYLYAPINVKNILEGIFSAVRNEMAQLRQYYIACDEQ